MDFKFLEVFIPTYLTQNSRRTAKSSGRITNEGIFEGSHFLVASGVKANALRFIVEDKRAKIYGFVLMPHHHMLWKIEMQLRLEDVQRDFTK